MKEQRKPEIRSFNDAVPELSKLLEVTGAELDYVVGGGVGPVDTCPVDGCPLKMLDPPWPTEG